MRGRTAKDEYQLDEQLRREESIKTEVIVELREQNRVLLASQERLLAALCEAQASLQTYRISALENTRQAIQSSTDCIPGCTKHYWGTADGWHRKGETK